MLRAAWFQYLDKRYETRLAERGVEEESWKTFKETDMDAPREDSLVVKEELKGFWTIDGREWVIEGECPVRRAARHTGKNSHGCRCVGRRYRVGSPRPNRVLAASSR